MSLFPTSSSSVQVAKFLSVLVLASAVIFGCSSPTENEPEVSSLSATVDGQQLTCDAATISKNISGSTLVLTGSSGSLEANTLRSFIITIPGGSGKVGSFSIDSLSVIGLSANIQYREGVLGLFQTPDDGEGKVTITTNDATRLEGSFSVVLTGIDLTTGSKIKRTITNGKFTVL